ncbi:MAG TPA: RidA family protein [Candidatus Koribacter sp.]
MKLRTVLLILIVPTLLAAQQPDRTHLKSEVAKQRNLPFSSGVLVGNTLYVAGTTGVGPTTKGTVTAEQEARMALDNFKQVVEQAGMTMDEIVSLQVFCTDLTQYETFNKVYASYFHGDFPARAFLGTDKLLFNARFEINGIAVKSAK